MVSTKSHSVSIRHCSDEYLSNVVWTALNGTNEKLVQRSELGARYKPEFAPFGAAEDYSKRTVLDILTMLSGHERLALFTSERLTVPVGYEVSVEATAIQMIGCYKDSHQEVDEIVRLGEGDHPEMMALVDLTQPGPFAKRTHALGAYIGIRREGRLVAMAGERMVAGKFVEVSAVCTHPKWRRKGLAMQLVERLSADIQKRESMPFVHVFLGNAAAQKMYTELGFQELRRFHLTVIARRA